MAFICYFLYNKLNHKKSLPAFVCFEGYKSKHMKVKVANIKEKMSELTRLFSNEQNTFQRFVIVQDYMHFLNTEPLAKGVMQKIFDDTEFGRPEECTTDDEYLDAKGEAIYSQGFWMYFTNLEVIAEKMDRLRQTELKDKKQLESLCHIFSKTYSNPVLELSFQVVNSEVFNRLDQACFIAAAKVHDKTYFDEDKSILHIKDERIYINRQDKITNAHKLLHHIFITNKNNLNDDFYYSEIAEDEFHELDYKHRKNNWQPYYRTCELIVERVEAETKDHIKDFLIFNTGEKGKVKVNPKYL